MTYTLEQLASENEITRLIYAYCTGIDTGRLDDAARLFEHGTWHVNGQAIFTGFTALSDFLRRNVLLYDGVPCTRHVVSNICINVAHGADTARALSYAIVYQTAPGCTPEIIFQGSNDDSFARDDQGWHFTDRRLNVDGVGDLSRHFIQGNRAPVLPQNGT
jgi:hypothetical protein